MLCSGWVAGLVFITASAAFAADWPAWRGPFGNGHSAEKNLPLTWNGKNNENIKWKVKLPGPGNSSPIVWGQRVFITQSIDAKGKRRALMCFDRKNGDLVWAKETPYDEVEATHGTNPYCAETPVTDGERVYASFGSAGLVCYDMDGNEKWRKGLGKIQHIWGTASSPILYHDLIILWCSPGERQFLVAFDKRTGEKKWHHDEPGGKFGQDPKDWLGTWCTPFIAKVGDHDELFLSVPRKLRAFNPRTGEQLWWCDGLGPLFYTSAVCSPDGIVLAMSGFHGPAMAVKAGGKGDVTKTHRLWHEAKNIPQRIGSPVIVGGHAYVLSTPGAAQCIELKTGKDLWNRQRLGDQCWSSMVLAGHRLYVANDAGDTYVLKASPEFEQLAHNSLGPETVRASLAVSDGDIFIRSYRHLWCIGEP